MITEIHVKTLNLLVQKLSVVGNKMVTSTTIIQVNWLLIQAVIWQNCHEKYWCNCIILGTHQLTCCKSYQWYKIETVVPHGTPSDIVLCTSISAFKNALKLYYCIRLFYCFFFFRVPLTLAFFAVRNLHSVCYANRWCFSIKKIYFVEIIHFVILTLSVKLWHTLDLTWKSFR